MHPQSNQTYIELYFYYRGLPLEMLIRKTNTCGIILSVSLRSTMSKIRQWCVKLEIFDKSSSQFACYLHIFCMQHVSNSSLMQLFKAIQGTHLNDLVGYIVSLHLGISNNAITIFNCKVAEVNSSKQFKVSILTMWLAI